MLTLPKPISFHEAFIHDHLGAADLHLPLPINPIRIEIDRQSDRQLFARPRISTDVIAGFDHAQFLVVNGPDLFGKAIRKGNAGFTGRHTADLGAASVVIDALRPKGKRTNAPYEITHTARVTLALGTKSSDLDAIASAIFKTLSLVRGRWVGLVGPWLFDKNHQLLTVVPQVTKASYQGSSFTWCSDIVPDVIEELLPCIYRAFRDNRNDALQTALHWYIESELCSGAVEGSLVLQQAALEALAWSEVVEHKKLCSIGGFEKLPASDKIKWLASLFSIPVGIPPQAKDVMAYANENNLPDLPAVLAHVRNALVHGTPSKAQKLFDRLSGDDERTNLWHLIGGVLAQCVLAVAGYRGKLVRRDLGVVWSHAAVRQVPWAT